MAKKKSKQKNSKQKQDLGHIQGLVLFAFAVGLLISLLSFSYGESHNWLGLVGSKVGWFFHGLLGLGSYIFTFALGWVGWRKMFIKPIHHPLAKFGFITLFILSICMLLNLFEHTFPSVATVMRQLFYPYQWQRKMRYHLGGAPLFYFFSDLPLFNLHRIFNTLGVGILFLSSSIVSLIYLAKISPSKVLHTLSSGWNAFIKEIKDSFNTIKKPIKKEDDLRLVKLRTAETIAQNQNNPDLLAIQPETNLKVRPSLSRKESEEPTGTLPFAGELRQSPKPVIAPPVKEVEKAPPTRNKRDAALAAQRVHNGDFTGYKTPSQNLLTNPKKVDQNLLRKDLKRQAEVLEETLQSFGIEAKVGQINCGPTITSFEVHPAIGVKVQKIKTLENDIALNMEAKSMRIIAPIPGKAAVGIEVPNAQPQEVSFKEMLASYLQEGRKLHIPLLLGKAVNGENVVNDLTKMPHCIIAGATGSGKSVCINTIIMSILMTAKPDEIKLIMVDPKKVELTPYTRLPHMLAPVITEPQGACAALNWLVKEMERRYEILKQIGTRNIDAFNSRTVNKELEESLEIEVPAKMPFIVGIIDELADLMMVASQDIETPIARIAQMARAVGIHLILATQRPSREVITGLIKANFPTRISFKVASRVNSQIVLDETGAECLLGNGDMLFLPPGSSHLIRAQGAFIRDEDINGVVKSICEQAPPNYVIESFDQYRSQDLDDVEEDPSSVDSLYQDALSTVLGTGNASTTFLQRKLKIGYARAASLMDQLERQGIVGPAEGSKPRKILASKKLAENSHLGFDDEFEENNEE